MDESLIIERFKKAYPSLSLSTIKKIAEKGEVISIQKKELFIKRGERRQILAFVLNGLFRGIINKDGDEITLWFSGEYEVIASYMDILKNEPAKITYQALENSEVFVIPYEEIKKMAAVDTQLLLGINGILENLLMESFLRVEKFVLYSAEERYLHLLETKPAIINRVSQKLLASYIGITPVSLSRLRARLQKG